MYKVETLTNSSDLGIGSELEEILNKHRHTHTLFQVIHMPTHETTSRQEYAVMQTKHVDSAYASPPTPFNLIDNKIIGHTVFVILVELGSKTL